jgi:hypothetical protein
MLGGLDQLLAGRIWRAALSLLMALGFLAIAYELRRRLRGRHGARWER